MPINLHLLNGFYPPEPVNSGALCVTIASLLEYHKTIEIVINHPNGATMYSSTIDINNSTPISSEWSKIVAPDAIVYINTSGIGAILYTIIINEANQASWISGNQGNQYFTIGVNYTASTTLYTRIYDNSLINPVSAGPITVTAISAKKPQNVRAYGVDGGIYIMWDAPSGDGVEPTSFKIYRSNGYSPQIIDTISASERSYLMTGLQNGIEYSVAVFSESGNPGGTYPDPAAFKAATPQLVPDAPVLQGVADNSGQILLSWNTPSVPAGISLSDYVLYFRLNGQDVSGALGLVNSTMFNTPGLLGVLFPYGSAHSFYLRARGSNGAEGLPSNTVSVTPRVVSLSAALAGGQSIASFVSTSTQSAADIAVSSIAAVKQTYASDPTQKAAQLTTLFTALKTKAQEADPSAKAVSIASSAASGLINLLVEKPASLPDKPAKIVVDPIVSVEELGDMTSSYVYFNLPQRFTKGSRWIEFAAGGTYTTSESTAPAPFSMDSLVVAGGLAVQLRALGSGFGDIQSVFTATFSSKSDTTVTYTLAGVDGGAAPTSVSVSGGGSSSSLTGGTLVISGLTAATSYTFTIESPGYVAVTTAAVTTDAAPGGGVDPICFLADAPVLTPGGYRRIADLRVGDVVTTADGRRVAVRAVKVMTCAAGPASNPFIIPRGKFGAVEELMISPRHRVAVGGGRMVEARDLGLAQAKMGGVITYYNVELPNWEGDNLVVAGVEVESLAPVRRRAVSAAMFKRMVLRTYGADVTPAAMAKILRVCRFLPNGDVEIPYMKRSS